MTAANNNTAPDAVEEALKAAGQSKESDVSRAINVAKTTGSLDEGKFMAMLALLVKKEARLAETEAALEQALQARDQQRKHQSESYTISKIETQKACKHLKGGKSRTRGQQKDPNVYSHQFTDRTVVIKCNGCGARWFSGDTKEYLTRNGSKIPNWTNIGWNEAREMAEDSSNRASSSEVFPDKYIDNTVVGKKQRSEHLNVPNLQL